jgi:hypothetical protein
MAGSSKTAIKVAIDGRKYTYDFKTITLGEGQFLKANFGLESYNEVRLTDPDPDLLVGVLALAMKREHPELDDDEIIAKVRAVPASAYFDPVDEWIEAEVKRKQAEEADPQPAGGKDSAPAGASKSGMTPETPGKPS